MAKIKLHLSSKVADAEPESFSVKEEVASPTTLKIKPPRKVSKPTKNSSTTANLPKITFKNFSASDSLPKIKFQGVSGSMASMMTDLPDVKIEMKTPKLRVKPVRLPGNGYDSEDPDKEDDPLLEEAIVLRFLPDESLDIVRAVVENSERTGDKNVDRSGIDLSCISITWIDKRRAIVRINDIMYAAKLVHLPTISEIHKTIDKKNIFKTVDVCQMLLVVKRISDECEATSLKIDKEYGETFPDGLTSPLESIKDKFEKKYESEVIQNVEDEVARLLKLDAEAESSVFEFADAEKEDIAPMSVIETKMRNKRAKKEKKRRRKEQERLQQENQNTENGNVNDKEDAGNDELDDQFGDLDDELDRLMGENEDDDEGVQGENDDDDDEDEDDEDDGVEDKLRDANLSGDEDAQHHALIMEEISELESTISQKEKDLKKAINPIMKNRIMNVISRLEQELEMKKQLIATEEQKEDKKDEEDEDEEDENQGERTDEEDRYGDANNSDGNAEDKETSNQRVSSNLVLADSDENEDVEIDDEYGDLF